MTQWVEWIQESLLYYNHFRMKVSCLFYPPECMFLAAQLTDKPGCSERAPEEGKYVGHFVGFFTESAPWYVLDFSKCSHVSAFSEKLAIESLMLHLNGVIYFTSQTDTELKHIRERIKIVLALFSAIWLSFHGNVISRKLAILPKVNGGMCYHGACLRVGTLPFLC